MLSFYNLFNVVDTSSLDYLGFSEDLTRIKPCTSSTKASSVLQFTIPEGKLFYPEPFIASPSYIHSDLTFLHIFQYWYWLWFMFIFLICFFFISFISTVRWCALRTRPRRETRGVSRSKCGDLITACVPVSWAISIIVNESTDATDLSDGFGTAELIVGVRAYQWGWEYYYPKSIDLNYSVRPSYSSFIGNSLRYNTSSSKNVLATSLWRMYQNKSEERVITPSHLLLLPLDFGNVASFTSFKDIGLNTLQESSSFSKIRNSSKVYKSHLVHTPNVFSHKYLVLNKIFMDENNYLTSGSFGIKKQHNLLSVEALGNSFNPTWLDEAGFNHFIKTSTNATVSGSSADHVGSPSPLSPTKANVLANSSASNSLTQLLAHTPQSSNPTLARLTSYPTLLDHLNDNSDKKGLLRPTFKISSPTLLHPTLLNSSAAFTKNQPDDLSSSSVKFDDLTLLNSPLNSRALGLANANLKVLGSDQSVRNFPKLSPTSTNLNLSPAVNTVSTGLLLSEQLNRTLSPFTAALDASSGFIDNSLFAKVASSRTFSSTTHPAIHSTTRQSLNSLEFDSTTHTLDRSYSALRSLAEVSSPSPVNTLVSDIFVGSRERTPKSINTAYWSTFWSTSTPNHRVSTALKANSARAQFYLPTFSNYSDYDFRNDQAIDMLEELFWENSYSGYNFYDYMSMSKSGVNPSPAPIKKEAVLDIFFSNTLLGLERADTVGYPKLRSDLTPFGTAYSNSVQMGDHPLTPNTLSTDAFSLLPIFGETSELDESFKCFKGLVGIVDRSSTSLLGASTSHFAPRSYVSVFNHFRSDFDDFSWGQNTHEVSNYPASGGESSAEALVSDVSAHPSYSAATCAGSLTGSTLRISNLSTLRPSVRNSIVNYNAFQKVFRARLDESRAHVNTLSFADLGLHQPFLSDKKVPYLQLLGKNRDSFYDTPLYSASSQPNLNSFSSLVESLNTPMYDFPFLLAKTSDTARFTWVDWFAKWKHIEVQPSSVSKYSTLGVPYLRKPFDFNSVTGDKFQDTELYFTRVARSRRNFLTNWSYSPYLYNRSYIWPHNSTLDSLESLFLPTHSCKLGSTYQVCKLSSNLSTRAGLSNTNGVSASSTYSSSGNSVYGKSTWQPKVGIQSYYYKVSKLVDLLSKREFLYRKYIESCTGCTKIPSYVCATPSNSLLRELTSSLQFCDPANYSSEYSRELLYTSSPFLKFAYLQNLATLLNSESHSLPLNHSLLTNYLLFYFFSTTNSEMGSNSELFKSQYRPLKKGISSMLRLHATGAVAMPVEIRLQVLASSRDVIHSWSIPSASVKIDCVPGYTSHRMMKFLLTGVYWGQCQEICGRYHHWMPIVVYFMKRDLFFLWCTHFVFKPAPNKTWDISDKRFSSLIQFTSYDKSSWLTEFSSN